MELTRTTIGVDVGGTNTDAVIINWSTDKPTILARAKTISTSDITTGVRAAIHLALLDLKDENRKLSVQQVNIGTSIFMNALIEVENLSRVAVIRLCGTASRKLPPFSDFPNQLADAIKGSVFLLNGGYQCDGTEITAIDEEEVQSCVDALKRNGETNIVVSGIYSPLRDQQELNVIQQIHKQFPEASVTASHKTGKIGLLERENAAILNECIKPLYTRKLKEFRSALNDIGLTCPMFLTQNDGTILQEDEAIHFPIYSFASGTTNSIRGAAFLTGLKNAIVFDIGGTTTDIGILQNGFVREASADVKVGGLRTNIRLPDILSIWLGDGSYVTSENVEGHVKIEIGPQSASFCIEKDAYVFSEQDTLSGRVVTAFDIAVASGIDKVGQSKNCEHLSKNEVDEAVNKIYNIINTSVSQMSFSDKDLPIIFVGGGSVIIDTNWKFDGVSELYRPEYYDIANSIGAALSQISTIKDQTVAFGQFLKIPEMNAEISSKLEEVTLTTEKTKIIEEVRKVYLHKAREDAVNEILEQAKKETIESGAHPDSLSLVYKDDIPLTYIPGNMTRIKVKVVGDVKFNSTSETYKVPESVFQLEVKIGVKTKQQTVTKFGALLSEAENTDRIEKPHIDQSTGEWLVSEYDIECLHIGAGIMGCGGGGSHYLGRLSAIETLRNGKKIRIVTPSRFYNHAHPENDLVSIVAFMGEPAVIYEKLINGNETVDALKCMQELYISGQYEDGEIRNKEEIEIKTKDGITYIDDFKTFCDVVSKPHVKTEGKRIAALMSVGIGGLNCIEPLVVGAALDLPILDCDGMGRSLPELQMFTPFIYGSNSYPVTLVDDKGRRAVVLFADSPKSLEDHLREVVISMGSSGGIALSQFDKDRIESSTVQYSISHAWRIGDTVLRARAEKRSAVDAVVKSENGKLLIIGKITNVVRDTSGGFDKGKLILEGLNEFNGKTVVIEFKNEVLVAREIGDKINNVLACVPDLVTLMNADTAQPIPKEETKVGMRVAVVAMRASPMLTTAQALKFVGPQAFGYGDDVKYIPLCDFIDAGPVGPK